MRDAVIGAIVLGLVFAVVACAPDNGKAIVPDSAEAIGLIDRSLQSAISADDERAVGRRLAAKFTLTDAAGKRWLKSAVLKDVESFGGEENDVTINFYNTLAVVMGTRKDTRFARVWAKRVLGWRLFAAIETPIAAAPVEVATAAGDCVNPCRSVPYAAKSEVESAVLAAWQRLETVKWQPNADAVADGLADEFAGVTSSGLRGREQIVAAVRRGEGQRKGQPGDPVDFMRIHVFGVATALILTRQTPFAGGRPYAGLRVWILRAGRWRETLSQETTIEAAPPVPPTGSGD
ncbi:MAG: hypothetical protein HY056_13780 [Proteobacteria bacterium]|nr:hypothetical protein [Pseudomonadota bacterium]